MSSANFDACLSFTLKFEGGFVNDPKDPGGATNFGVTIFTLSDLMKKKATIADVKALTPAKVAPIYRQRYWDKARGDDLPIGIDLAVFDFGVHSGPIRGVKMLQRTMGLEDDGNVGDVTLKVVRSADPVAVIKALCASRLAFLQGLDVFKSFGPGLTNRVDRAQAAALSMLP